MHVFIASVAVPWTTLPEAIQEADYILVLRPKSRLVSLDLTGTQTADATKARVKIPLN